jgi:hypothetical protein
MALAGVGADRFGSMRRLMMVLMRKTAGVAAAGG